MNIPSKLFFIPVCILFFAGCKTEKMNTYQYADGSGNIYNLGNSQTLLLEYIPVKPSESSSGTYSGGEAVKKQITSGQFAEIVKAISEAQSDKSLHIENRVMMSGAVSIISNGKEKNFILKPGCENIKIIENALKEALK